jgi:hypothetical protein
MTNEEIIFVLKTNAFWLRSELKDLLKVLKTFSQNTKIIPDLEEKTTEIVHEKFKKDENPDIKIASKILKYIEKIELNTTIKQISTMDVLFEEIFQLFSEFSFFDENIGQITSNPFCDDVDWNKLSYEDLKRVALQDISYNIRTSIRDILSSYAYRKRFST